MKNTLALIRDKLGHGHIRKFVEQELHIQYRTFTYQCSRGMVPYKTIVTLLKKLDITFDELKSYKYIPDPLVHSQQKRDIKKSMTDLHVAKPKKLSEILKK